MTGLVLTAPFAFLGLVLLPVGFLLQIGSQSVLRVTNGTDRTLWVTPLGTHRKDGRRAILRQAMSGLAPLPALRGADLRVEPGATRTLVYKPGEYRASGLVARDASGDARQVPPGPSRDLRIERFVDLPAAPPELAALSRESPQLLPWLVVATGVMGLAAFLQLLRVRRRLEKGQP